MEISFLEWRPHPSNPQHPNQAANEATLNESTIMSKLFEMHYMMNLLGLFLMDKNFIFMTSFECMIFLMVYVIHSFTIASEKLISDFNKKVSFNFV